MTKDLENLRKGLETDRTKKKILSDQKNALKVGLEECKRNKKKLTKKFSLKDMTLAYKNKEASLESLRVQEQSFIMDERKAKKEAEIILKMVESTSDYLMSV